MQIFGKKKKSLRPDSLLYILFFLIMIIILNQGLNTLATTKEEEVLNSVKNTVNRAVITFYAIEGRYPPGIDYLIENRGLIVDLDRFTVHYNFIGANIMPQIIVVRN